MRPLYPEIKPYMHDMLAVDDTHRLYYEQCGSADGIPVVFVHGGPGMGCNSDCRRFFDPEKFRIVLFDQRGAGRSEPHASLKDNTTEHLIEDMERLRQQLGVKRWLLFGGSWGSTLSLAYAQAHPQRVLGMVLRGIFLCRRQDIAWFYQGGAAHVYPDYWQDYLQPIDIEERGNLVQAFYKRLTSDNELTRMAAAKAWSVWEGRCATLRPSENLVDHFSDPHTALALARIEAHYFAHDSFMEEGQLLKNAAVLQDIPGYIVHGRYDMVCPLDNAFALHRVWPRAELDIIRDAGHSAFEPGITDALIRATDSFAHLFKQDFNPSA